MRKYVISILILIAFLVWGQVWASNNPEKAIESLEAESGKVVK